MTRTWVAVVTAVLVAVSTSRAGEFATGPVSAPTPIAAGCPTVTCGDACGTQCASGHGHRLRCKVHDARSCCDKLCDWLTYRSHCTRCGECRSCMDVYPPLYLYFVVPCCKEGAPCHAPPCGKPECGPCADVHHLNLLGPVCPRGPGCGAACGAACK